MNNDYDTYSDFVVCAESELAARMICPDGSPFVEGEDSWSWTNHLSDIKAELIGIAVKDIAAGTIICSSFHAG